MKLRISEDKKFLVVDDCTSNEIDQLEYSFTKKVNNYFIIKKKMPHWDGEVKFVDRYNRIPIGLWQEVKKLCERFHFPLQIEGIENLIDSTHDFKHFEKWAIEYFAESKKTPRDYQIEAVNRLIKFRNCTEEISTSGGKTLIAFLFFKYLFDHKKIKKLLYIVPNVNLVTQSEEEFYDYEDECDKRPNWKSECAFGGKKRKKEDGINIIFGTYQTLSKKGPEYFADIDAVCVDETHHAKANSIRNILMQCYNATYKFGLTGTLPAEGSYDSFTIQSYLGPKVYTIHSADLIASGKATPVNVIGIELDYLDNETKRRLYDLRNVPSEEKDGAKLLNLEKDIARASRKRMKYISEMLINTTKNTLVLFSDIKNDYGRSIYQYVKEHSDKKLYYIDGSTKNDNRDYFKQQMEDNDDCHIVASMGTFSEGISINNVHNIFVIETSKSEFIVRQILGRGMRLMPGKESMSVIDFSDNFEYGSGYQKENYLMRHSKAREKIYHEKRFPFKRFKVKL